jgi:DNA-binding NarL/FixJ family response regulator
MQKIHAILIIDDHLLFAQGLKLLIESKPGYKVSEIIQNNDTLNSKIKSLEVDVILLDVNLNGVLSFEVCKKLKTQLPQTKVIAVSMHHEYNIINQMRKAGADGYILKNASQASILAGIDEVLLGKKYFEEEVKSIISNAKNQKPEGIELLNPREKKILNLVLKDNTNKKIADEMKLSIKTIEFYRNSIYTKLDVKNLLQLVQKTKELNYRYED